MFNRLIKSLVLLLLTLPALGQKGTIRGIVTDNETGKPIFYAKVRIDSTLYKTASKRDGVYTLSNVKPGNYTVKAVYSRLGTKVMPNVIVKAGDTTFLDIPMGKNFSVTKGTGSTFTFHKVKTTTEAAVNEQKESTTVKNVQSSQALEESGDNNAAAGTKRISGVSVVGGKYVFVRGLSDRYTKTLLNNSEIPGLDPNRNSVQLDLFPSPFISSISVIKTFSPDLPGDFTGGLIDIRTKEYTDKLTIKVGGSLGYNSQSSFNNNFLLYKGGKTDWLGYDDGTRDFPTSVSNDLENNTLPEVGEALTDRESGEKYDENIKSFNKIMTPERMSSFTNHSFNFTIGNKVKIKRKDSTLKPREFGYFGGASYRRKYEYFEGGNIGIYNLTDQVDNVNELNARRLLEGDRGADNVLIGLMLNTQYRFNKKHKIGLNVLKNQSGSSSATYYDGYIDEDPSIVYRSQKLRYLERGITSFQFHGEHKYDSTLISHSPLKIDWLTAFTQSYQKEPDLRYYTDDYQVQSGGDTSYQFRSIYTAPGRYNRRMDEINFDGKLNLTWDKTRKKDKADYVIKIGGSAVYKQREFTEQRVDLTQQNGDYNGNSLNYLRDENIGVLEYGIINDLGVGLLNSTFDRNSYDGTKSVMAAYAMTEYPLTKKLDFVGGARFERADIVVKSRDLTVPLGELRDNDVLPSLNFIYKLKDGKKVVSRRDTNEYNNVDMKLRLSYNRTLARPNFRELAPYSTEDYDRGLVLIGNNQLERTQIDNFDTRWELYPRDGELISVSAFYKRFINPIELVINPIAANPEMQWRNVDLAQLYGVELEFRKNLDFLGRAFKKIDGGTNFTFVKSFIDINEEELEAIRATDTYHSSTRPLFGQSPYLINAYLNYKNDSTGWGANVSFNIFGKRLAIINGGGTPNVYEMPNGSLNLSLSKRIGKFNFRVRAKNLLNPYFKMIYLFDGQNEAYDRLNSEEYVYQRYKKGRSFSLSVSYKFVKSKKKK